jgi:hypothetical protein
MTDKTTMFIFLGVGLFVGLSIFLFDEFQYGDSLNDIKVCKAEFLDVFGIDKIPHVSAMEDYWKINLGKNIHCEVYWNKNGKPYAISFTSGNLINQIKEMELKDE